MHDVFPRLTLGQSDPHQTLVKAVLDDFPIDVHTHSVSDEALFSCIQDVLTVKYISLLPADIGRTIQDDFFKSVVDRSAGKQSLNKAYIDSLMAYSEDQTPETYIHALLKLCLPHLATMQETSLFYQVNKDSPDKAERLSMMTQFYLGVLNIHCRAKGKSRKNFGQILDNNAELSQALVDTVSSALTQGHDVEHAIITFVNAHKKATEFNLSDDLSPADKEAIQAKFEIT